VLHKHTDEYTSVLHSCQLRSVFSLAGSQHVDYCPVDLARLPRPYGVVFQQAAWIDTSTAVKHVDQWGRGEMYVVPFIQGCHESRQAATTTSTTGGLVGPYCQVWEANGGPTSAKASASGSGTSVWSSVAQTSTTSCGGLVNRALRVGPLWPEQARCPWVSKDETPAPGRPADTRHWPTGTDSSTGPSERGG